jgi:hypothetical protein
MSPVSRGPKGAKPRKRGDEARVLRSVPTFEPDPCDCPACTGEEAGEEVDIEAMLTGLRAASSELLGDIDPIEPELLAALFLSAGDVADEDAAGQFSEAFTHDVVPLLAAAGDPSSLALLTSFELVGGSAEAGRAARQLVADAVAEPAWAAEAREPLTTRQVLTFRAGSDASILICTFDRAGRRHGFVVQIDHAECFAATHIMLVGTEVLDQVIADLPGQTMRGGRKVVEQRLTPEEFRWEIERALDARAVHDEENGPQPEDPDDEGGLDYYTAATLLRSRMRTLPEPTRPPAAHGEDDPHPGPPSPITQIADGYESRRRRQADSRDRRNRP